MRNLNICHTPHFFTVNAIFVVYIFLTIAA